MWTDGRMILEYPVDLPRGLNGLYYTGPMAFGPPYAKNR